MTTTVELDPDVERMLRTKMEQSNKSLRETTNNILREVCDNSSGVMSLPPAFRTLELREGIDPYKVRQFADDLEAEEIIRKQQAEPKP